jgi:hypothetical protein
MPPLSTVDAGLGAPSEQPTATRAKNSADKELRAALLSKFREGVTKDSGTGI